MTQGTIKSFDPATRTGVLLDDAQNEYAFDYESFRNTGARLFRLGQRIKFRATGEGRRAKVHDLTIITL